VYYVSSNSVQCGVNSHSDVCNLARLACECGKCHLHIRVVAMCSSMRDIENKTSRK